jgi:membrane protein implicated in regulation of membrane protease activity
VAKRRAAPKAPVEWDFFSFPVFAAAAVGAFVTVMVVGIFPVTTPVVFIVSLFGVSFSTAHVITHVFRRRAAERETAKREEAERERRALAARTAQAEGAPERPRRRRRRR